VHAAPGDENFDNFFQVRPIQDHFFEAKTIYFLFVTGYSLVPLIFDSTTGWGIY